MSVCKIARKAASSLLFFPISPGFGGFLDATNGTARRDELLERLPTHAIIHG